ncbi:unnamed protein product [Oikopleura dioica]|uniref:F-box domain-containing protein n=1 Tax=Oikopleura dioica TaxID=34765 RepID=E4XVA2_OIKDI|nr:unnamed protein product [Oikopleura dioica]
MRLRFKEPALNITVTVEASDLAELHQKISAEIGSPETVILSLNGSEPLPQVGSLSELGIVGGDRIRIITADPGTSQAYIRKGDIFEQRNFKLEENGEQQKTFTYVPIPGAKLNLLVTDIPGAEKKVVNMIGTYEATVFTESFIADSDEHVNQQSPDLLSKIIRKFEDLSGICTNNLLALPDEILHSICGHLDAKSLGKLRTSCSRLHRVCSDEGLWRKLYFKDFTTIGVDEGSWRKLYAVSFERSSTARPRATRSQPAIRVEPTFPDLREPPRHPFPGVPGMIGGDYDLRFEQNLINPL